MAKSSNTSKPSDETIKAAILDAVAELWDQHVEQIVEIRDKSEGKSITVNFANEIDCSDSQAVVKTKIRFCETFTDERTNKIDDRDQTTFETIENQGRGGRKTKPEKDGEKAEEGK